MFARKEKGREIVEMKKVNMAKTVPGKSIPTKLKEKEIICKMKNFRILLSFLLITTTVLVLVWLLVFIADLKYQAKKNIYYFFTMLVMKKSILKIYYKMENNKLKEVNFKNCTCYYFDHIIEIEDFDFDNICIDEKS